MFGWITWDRTGPLGGKCRTVGWEGRGVVLVSQHLQGCSPHLCRLRTDVLVPVSKYWMYRLHVDDMGPVSLVACRRQMLGFTPTASLVGSREKLGTDPRIGQPTCCGLCQKSFFSGAVALLNSIDDLWKVAMYEDCPQKAYVRHTWTNELSCNWCCVAEYT
jgi:hypothetical protein